MLKPVECITLTVNLNVNYELWVIMIYQGRLITSTITDILFWGGGQVVRVWEREVVNSLCFLFNFIANLKLH